MNKKFVSKVYGENFSISFDVTKRPEYQESYLALYILTGKNKAKIDKLNPSILLSGINNILRKSIWYFLLFLPKNFSVKLLRIWWSQLPYKRYFNFFSKYMHCFIL